jgi:hypothetical protein
VAVWLALVGALARTAPTALPAASLWRATLWLWLYLFAIHSVFESAGKYHVPVLWVPCVLLAVLLAALPRQAGRP